jgi:hypothetical protein
VLGLQRLGVSGGGILGAGKWRGVCWRGWGLCGRGKVGKIFAWVVSAPVGAPRLVECLPLWRGDLSPLGCEVALKPDNSVCQGDWLHF